MINCRGLTFQYRGSEKQVLKGLDFHIDKGEIFGFLGPSGAGKSTTQKVLMGLLKGYGGQAEIFGSEMSETGSDFYERIGSAFEFPNFYLKFTALDNLNFFGSLYKGKKRDPRGLLSAVGLSEDAQKTVGEFSKGMKIRLNLCRALLHDPELLFLDEPTSGLDPVNARTVMEIIKEEKRAGKTIFLTTHNMTTAAELCDRVAFIVDGALPLIDSPRALTLRFGEPKVAVEYREGDNTLKSRLFDLKGLGDNGEFLDILKNRSVETMHSREATLDDVFITTTGRTLL